MTMPLWLYITLVLFLSLAGIVALINRWVRALEVAARRDTEPVAEHEARRREFVAAAVVSRKRFR